MPPKRQQRNGFWYFMLDFKKAAENQGISFPGGMKDVQNDPECSRQWKSLSKVDRTHYSDLARRYKCRSMKLTGCGEPIAFIKERQRKIAEAEANMKSDILETIRMGQECKNIQNISFFFIHVQYFYTKDRSDSSVDYTPAEMAIIEYSIAEGVKGFYHQIINVQVEMGYARETLEHGERTHKIPTDYVKGEKDYFKIYEMFREFLQPTIDRTGKIPPVYTSKRFSNVVTCFLDRMIRAADLNDDVFSLYSLEYLYGNLMIMCNPDIDNHRINPEILAESELEKDAFAYSPNIDCEYHSKIDGASIHCSLATVRQWGFSICDYCCNFLGIEMIPDVHCPASSLTDDSDLLATGMACLAIDKKFLPGTVKSMTGVTEAYRLKKAARTPKEDEERRKKALLNPLVIIDHSLNLPPPPPLPPPASVRLLKPLRAPKSLALSPKESGNLQFSMTDFPELGASRTSHQTK
ncbi:protein maelstrom homolog [Fopius arisanus]|uniref:Mael_1 protein n=1 Tax=Fopius arisanus TaxID=64838 RepID=A0A0C9R9V5_9HYME|nr:PREDICTED: protein maelstrom homolog [Fopius arisanus]